MEEYLAYFLDLRIRLRGRPEAVAIVDRCLVILSEAEAASPEARARLAEEIETLRQHLIERFGPRPPLSIH